MDVYRVPGVWTAEGLYVCIKDKLAGRKSGYFGLNPVVIDVSVGKQPCDTALRHVFRAITPVVFLQIYVYVKLSD